eukprot:2717770-Pleurochrysis_carterae.AAC.2
MRITAISAEPAFDKPDLDAFIKSYKPFKQFALFANKKELADLYFLPVADLLITCKQAGLARID